MDATSYPIVVLGASAGGVESLRRVVSTMPADFPCAVLVVLHIGASQPSTLPEILSRAGPLPACHPANGDVIQPGRVYIAPPDHHLLVDHGTMAVAKGPKENRFRPSIDALFRSAAYSYGSRAIGVVLSGALDDGTSGLWSIKRMGGITIVQSPEDAPFSSMPLSALAQVQVDYQVPAAELGALLVNLVASDALRHSAPHPELKQRLRTELDIALEGGAFQKGIMEIGNLTPFTCPECGGALVKLTEDMMTRYRCHTGHAYSDSALLEGVMEATGEMLWKVMRSLEEGVMLVKHMGQQIQEGGDETRANLYFSKAGDLETRSKLFHDMVLKHESLSADNLVATGDAPPPRV
jgi:two-component system chemotaxis response regulator CheB